MNKKLLTLLALFIVIGSVSAVSAFDLGDLFGGSDDQNQTVTVGGEKFNIPANYEEVDTPKDMSAPFEEFNKTTGASVIIKAFIDKDDDEKGYGICVFGNLTDSELDELAPASDNNATLAGINGTLYKDEGNVTVFRYVKDSKVVMITSSGDKDTIANAIIS